MRAKSLQSCSALCDPMGSSPPGSSVHGILQAIILKWIAISSRGSFLTQGLNPIDTLQSLALQADSLLSEPPQFSSVQLLSRVQLFATP